MSANSTQPFGRYAGSALTRRFIQFAQQLPHNWLGKQVAMLLRKAIMQFATLPIDIEIGDIKMRCYLRDNNSERKFVFMPWNFDPLELHFIHEHLPKDGVFIDIGANVGIYTLDAAIHMNTNGRILALEPNPPALTRLLFNLDATKQNRADWPSITVLPLGVSDEEKEFDLFLSDRNLGASSIVATAHLQKINPSTAAQPIPKIVRIACKPLLTILAEQRIAQIDIIKIDIEGAEDLALIPYLANAPAALLARFILIENSEELWAGDLLGALKRRGYRANKRSRRNCIYQLTAEV